ncbi:S-adenosyl-L-methionine-dependent methyltransferase [Xylariaceae sp. AK1471]|nr:S-adenosyl-L-methionine-dependent methyltransferase [Xylariaceae sp. AK1471]
MAPKTSALSDMIPNDPVTGQVQPTADVGSDNYNAEEAYHYNNNSEAQLKYGLFLLAKAAIFKISSAGGNTDALRSQLTKLVRDDGFVDATSLLALLEKIEVFKGAKVLDAGCGTGLLTKLMAKLVGLDGFVTGFDLEEPSISVANEKPMANLHFEVADVENLSKYPDDSYDFLVSNAAIHFFPHLDRVFEGFFRKLKPDGVLAVSTGSGDHSLLSLDIRMEVLSGKEYQGWVDPKDGILKFPMKNELIDLLDGANFQDYNIFIQPGSIVWKDGADAIAFLQASTGGKYLNRIPTKLREGAKTEMIEKLNRLLTNEGVRMNAMWLMAVACKTASPSSAAN